MSGKPIAEIRQKLDVQYIVEAACSRWQISSHRYPPHQTSDEAQAGSDSFTRELSNFFASGVGVAEAVAQQDFGDVARASLSANSQRTPPPGLIKAEAASKSSEAFPERRDPLTRRRSEEKHRLV